MNLNKLIYTAIISVLILLKSDLLQISIVSDTVKVKLIMNLNN